MGRRDARSRVAHLLCGFACRLDAVGLNEECRYGLPMRAADAVGLTPVHVNRTLRELRNEGLLTLSNRAIVINDLAKLEETGDFRSTYLHLSEPAR